MRELKYQFHLIQAIRNFFLSRDFVDVLTPPMVSHPGMETHIHPFEVHRTFNGTPTQMYLHTSPEFHMKNLLAEGFEKIFTIGYCFRDEPDDSPIHRNQFIMLEWYRSAQRYEKIMDDCEELFKYAHNFLKEKGGNVLSPLEKIKFERMTIQEVFQEYTGIDILQFLVKNDLEELIRKDFKDVPLLDDTSKLSWDDLYFLLFLNKIEPLLEKRDYLTLYEYPHHLSALSTIKGSDPRVCERFEVYVKGIELANCFNELTDLSIQKKRFKLQNEEKQQIYNYHLPQPDLLYRALEKGLPSSAGIALGVERLLASILDTEKIFYDQTIL